MILIDKVISPYIFNYKNLIIFLKNYLFINTILFKLEYEKWDVTMLGAPALLLVHPTIVFNSLHAPGVFFLLKLVAVLFFLLCLHCCFLHFLPLLLSCVGFSLLRELSLGSRWKCYGSVVIVAVVVSSSSTFKVRHFAAFCWVCVSWSVCVSYKYWSSWFVRSIQIKLIREIYTNQVDP